MSVYRYVGHLWTLASWKRRDTKKLVEAVGLMLDRYGDRLFHAAREGDVWRCDEATLEHHSRDRGIPVYATEPASSKRARLANHHDLHAQRGTIRGQLNHVHPYFLGTNGAGPLPVIHVVHVSGEATPVATWHKIDAADYSSRQKSQSNFDFDSLGTNSAQVIAPARAASTAYALGDERTNDGGKLYRVVAVSGGGVSGSGGGPTGTGTSITDGGVTWSYVKPWARYWVFIETPANFGAMTTYDDGSVYNGGQVYGGIAAAVARDIINMFLDWKSAHGSMWGLAFSSVALDPEATPTQDVDGWWNWPGAGEWGKLLSGGVPTRPPYLTWYYDRSQGIT